MKNLFALFFVLVFVCCTTVPKQKATAVAQQEANAPFDPYFVVSWDTVSTFGPHSITRSLLQAKNGDYWFATWQGIMHYDGKVFTNMTLQEGLIKFHVFSVFEDRSGKIWFGTVRGGMYCYDPAAEKGKAFTLFTTKDGLAGNTTYSASEDKEGHLWFSTDSGVSCYDGKTFTSFTTQDGLGDNDVNSIICDKAGKIWLGGRGGIDRYNPRGMNGKKFIPFTNNNGAHFHDVRCLLEDRNGNLWIGSVDGLCCYDGKTFKEMKPGFVSYMTEDKNGDFLISIGQPDTLDSATNRMRGFMMGLYRYDQKENMFTKIIEKRDPKDCQVFNVIEDNKGKIWFGTMKGVCCYDPAEVGENAFMNFRN